MVTKPAQKKLVLVKKEQPPPPAISEPVSSPPVAAITRDWNPVSPRAKSVQASPSIISRTQISPVIKSGIMSPPKQIDSPALESIAVSVSPRNLVQESTSLPPGLTRPVNGSSRPGQTQQRKKPEGAVVLPSSAPSISGQVQFGSFGIVKKTSIPSEPHPKSPEKLEESNTKAFQFNPPQSTSATAANTRPASSEHTSATGAPGLQTQYQQPVFGLGGAGYSMYESEQQRAMVTFELIFRVTLFLSNSQLMHTLQNMVKTPTVHHRTHLNHLQISTLMLLTRKHIFNHIHTIHII